MNTDGAGSTDVEQKEKRNEQDKNTSEESSRKLSDVKPTLSPDSTKNNFDTPEQTFKKSLLVKTANLSADDRSSRISFTPIMTNKSIERMKPRDFLKLRMLGKGDVGKVFLVTPKKAKWRKQGSNEATLSGNEVMAQISNVAKLNSGNNGSSNTPRGSKLPVPTELFAMKVVNKKDVIKRGKAKRVMLERDILASTNHPFIVTMYLALQTRHRLYFFLQYCPGGEFFRMLRRQPKKRIPESYAKFYAAEILLAIEYLHLLGFIYRDLKPENILVHMSGHLMLADFDLARLVKHSGKQKTPLVVRNNKKGYRTRSPHGPSRENQGGAGRNFNPFAACCGSASSMQPKIEDADMTVDTESQLNPTNASDRAMSFVGTVEYIAPEVIKNEGYAGTVDWWTFGILMYEMMHGTTPFKGKNNDDTFANIFLGTFDFPKDVETSPQCKSLLRLLLAKDLNDRLTSPSQIRQHAFFRGTNWALLRNETPPIIPNIEHPLDTRNFRSFKKFVESDEEFMGSKRSSNVDNPEYSDSKAEPSTSNKEADKITNKAEESKSSDEGVIEILSPVSIKVAADNEKAFEGFEWKTPRAEDPHWDDVNFVARSPKPVNMRKPEFLSRIQSVSAEAMKIQAETD